MDYSTMLYLATILGKLYYISLFLLIALTIITFAYFVSSKDGNEEEKKKNVNNPFFETLIRCNLPFDEVEKRMKLANELNECREKSIDSRSANLKILSGLTIIFLLLVVLIPTKQEVYTIVGGGKVLNYISNDSIASQIPKETTTLILNELKSLNKEIVK